MTGLHGGPGGESESLVINMSEDETDSEGTGNASLVETPAPASGQQGAGISRADQMQAANLLHTFYNAMESLLPFICLLMIKFMFDHRLGKLFILLSLCEQFLVVSNTQAMYRCTMKLTDQHIVVSVTVSLVL